MQIVADIVYTVFFGYIAMTMNPIGCNSPINYYRYHYGDVTISNNAYAL